MSVAQVILWGAGAYLGIGAVWATLLVWMLPRIDPVAKGAPWGFRLAVWPGCAALWPVLAVKLARERKT